MKKLMECSLIARLFSAMMFILLGTLEGLAQTQTLPDSIVTYEGFTATRGSGELGNQSYDKLVDGKYKRHPSSVSENSSLGEGEYWTKWCFPTEELTNYPLPDGGSENQNYYWVDFNAEAPISIASYILTTGNDTERFPGRNPKSWILKGKLGVNDSWTTITEVNNDSKMGAANFTDYDYNIDSPGTYQYFRFMVSELPPNIYSGSYLQLCELRFRNVILLPTPSHLNAMVTSDDDDKLVATLGWDAVDGAEAYQVCLNGDKDNLITVTTNSCTIPDLLPNTTYKFKVRSLKVLNLNGSYSYGLSEWSTENRFITTYDKWITVGNGSTTLVETPVYGWYVNYLQKNQFIFPASDLSIPTGNYITRLHFYADEPSVSLGNPQFEVYVGEVDKSYFLDNDDFFDWNTLTRVYKGSVSIDSYSMDIVFDDSYQYQGGNLIIGFNQTETVHYSYGHNTLWFGDQATGTLGSQTTYPSHYSYPGQSSYGFYLPKTTIYYSQKNIARPADLDYTLTQGDGSVATLSWTEKGTATSWEICLNDDEENLIEAESNPFTLTDLTPETRYTVKIRSVNGEDRSLWSEPVSFKPTDYYWITLYDGTETNDCVPVYGAKGETTNSNSQFIIPSELLSDISSDYYINRLTFYANKDNVNWGNNQYEVYVALTNYLTFTSTSQQTSVTPIWTNGGNMSNLTRVYNGKLSVSDHEMEITFDEPFQYQPYDLYKNLMIGIRQTEIGTSNSCNWYGVAQSKNTSIGGYIYPNLNNFVYLQQFSPKVTIGYSPENPIEAKIPKHLEVCYTGGTTAVVSWTSTETAWDIEVNGEVTEVTNPNSQTGLAYTTELTGLAYATEYNVRVRSRRDTTPPGVSDWTEPVSFKTDLAAEECQIDFFLTDARGDGWTGNAIKVVDVETGWVIDTVANDSDTPAGEEQWIVVDVPKNRSFRLEWVKGENPEDCSWRVIDVNNDEINSCAAGGASSFEDGYNIVVASTDCVVSRWKKPTDLTVRPFVSMAEISWTENSNPAATSWILAYKKDSDTDFIERWLEENPYTLTDLEPNNTYIVKVRPFSGDDNIFKWSKEVTFTLNGEYLVPSDLAATVNENDRQATLTWSGNSAQYKVRYRKAANYFEDFANGIPSSWTSIDADEDGHSWFNYTYELVDEYDNPDPELVIGQAYPASESYNYDEDEALTPDNWLITPRIPLQGELKVRLRSYAIYEEPEMFEIRLSTTGNSMDDFTTTLIPETSTSGEFVEFTLDLSGYDYDGQLGYIAIRHFNSTDNTMLLVDSFGFYESNEWTTVQVDDPEELIENLDANSIYEFQVQGINTDLPDGTAWSDVFTFYTYFSTYSKPGDVYVDGKLNILDVMALVNIIKGRDREEDGYDYNAADLDGNGGFGIMDVNMLINLIKGR